MAFSGCRPGFGGPVLAEEPHDECDQPGEREQFGEQGGAAPLVGSIGYPWWLRAEWSRLAVTVGSVTGGIHHYFWKLEPRLGRRGSSSIAMAAM